MIRSLLRSLGLARDPGVAAGQQRSSNWPAFLREHLRGKVCCVCGATDGLTLHHVVPVSVDASRELDPTNVVPICDDSSTKRCHIMIGHLGDWRRWNPDVRQHAATLLAARVAAIARQRAA